MLYLVEGEVYDSPHALPPEHTIMMFERAILPSLKMLAEWEESGKIKGGAVAGVRKGYFVIDAASHEELGQMLRSLPFWGILRWNTTPLQSFRSAAEGDSGAVERLKASLGGK